MCYARLLSRSGCGLVTVFENPPHVQCSFRTSSHTALSFIVLPWVYGKSSVFMQYIPSLHSLHFSHLFPILYSYSKTPPSPCAYCIGRQLSSPCPFLASTFAPTRRRLACYIHLHSVITSFRFIPQPHTPLHHFATLMVSFRFPYAGSRLFFLF